MIRQLARDCLAAGRVPEENNAEFVDYSNTPTDTRRECPNDRWDDVTVSTTSPVAQLFTLENDWVGGLAVQALVRRPPYYEALLFAIGQRVENTFFRLSPVPSSAPRRQLHGSFDQTGRQLLPTRDNGS